MSEFFQVGDRLWRRKKAAQECRVRVVDMTMSKCGAVSSVSIYTVKSIWVDISRLPQPYAPTSSMYHELIIRKVCRLCRLLTRYPKTIHWNMIQVALTSISGYSVGWVFRAYATEYPPYYEWSARQRARFQMCLQTCYFITQLNHVFKGASVFNLPAKPPRG